MYIKVHFLKLKAVKDCFKQKKNFQRLKKPKGMSKPKSINMFCYVL